MKKLTIYILLLLSTTLYAQEDKQSFNLDDILYLANSTSTKAYDFLKSRHFNYIRKDTSYKCFVYGLNYDKDLNTAIVYVYRYDNGKIKIQSPEVHRRVIEKQLVAFRLKTHLGDDGTATSDFNYKKHHISIVVNDAEHISDIYID